MNPNPKSKREVDKKYLDYVKKQTCLAFGLCVGWEEPYHVKTKGAGGSDRSTVPLCRKHHSECHQIGSVTFQSKYGINFNNEIKRLQREYEKRTKR